LYRAGWKASNDARPASLGPGSTTSPVSEGIFSRHGNFLGTSRVDDLRAF